jgi:hypothetical protein
VLLDAGTDGGWQVVAIAAGSSLAGSCTIIATVTFDGGIPPLTATTSVALVGLTRLAVYALGPEVASVPAAPPASGLVQGEDLVLLQCDADSYDQVKKLCAGWLPQLWAMLHAQLLSVSSLQVVQPGWVLLAAGIVACRKSQGCHES